MPLKRATKRREPLSEIDISSFSVISKNPFIRPQPSPTRSSPAIRSPARLPQRMMSSPLKQTSPMPRSAMSHSLADEDDPRCFRDSGDRDVTPSPARRLMDAFVASSGGGGRSSSGGRSRRESGGLGEGGRVGRVLFGGDENNDQEAEDDGGPGALLKPVHYRSILILLGEFFRICHFSRPYAVLVPTDSR
jgi:hypothetical protein